MDQPLCVVCNINPADMPRLVCYSDRDDLRTSLQELSRWFDAMLLPPVKSRGRGGKHHEPASPMSDRAREVRIEIVEIVLGWAALLYENSGAPNPPAGVATVRNIGAPIDDLIRYLRAGESWLLSAETAGSYVEEMRALVFKAQKTAAPDQRVSNVIIAVHRPVTVVEEDCDCRCHQDNNVDERRCTTEWGCYESHRTQDTGEACGGAVRIHRRAAVNEPVANTVTAFDDLVSGSTARCSSCGRTETVTWWHEKYPEQPDDALTDEEAARWLNRRLSLEYPQSSLKKITVATVVMWRHRGHIQALPERRRGRIATRRSDLADYANQRWHDALSA